MAEYFQWRGQNTVPTRPATVAYDRYYWSDLEPTPGVYAFDKLRLAYLTAAAKGQKFAFRVRAEGEVNDWRCPYPNNGWSDNTLMVGAWALLRNLGHALQMGGWLRHTAWIDIGILGSWGEWADIDTATDLVCEFVIDAHRQSFPGVQLAIKGVTRRSAVEYAMQDPSMGWFVNGLGDPGLTPRVQANWDLLTGHIGIGEFKAWEKMKLNAWPYSIARDQVREWGIRYVAQGPLPAWDSLSAADQCSLLEIAAEQDSEG